MIVWLASADLRYALVVSSAGTSPLLSRDDVVWLIRGAVVIEAILFFTAALVFALENVHWVEGRES